MPQTFSLFYDRSKHTMKALPSFFHLSLFLTFVLIAVLSLNFEVFRVLRLGDLLLLILAFVIGVHWYGQKMQEVGYRDALKDKKYAISGLWYSIQKYYIRNYCRY